jgi:hypothetical protein
LSFLGAVCCACAPADAGIETEEKMAESPVPETVNANVSDSSASTAPDVQYPRDLQLNTLKMSFIAKLETGSTVFLVPVKWFLVFTAWARRQGGEPGALDPASILCDAHGVVKEDSIEGTDYHLANEEGWNMIKQAYTSSDF